MSGNRARWRWVGALTAVFAAAQLVPIDRSNPPVESEVPAPPEVRAILERSCYDCHSNETKWPWYGYVAPVSWLLAHDVDEARSEMNFSKWKSYRPDEREKKLEEVLEEIGEGEMPPWFYLPLHPRAEVSAADRDVLEAWVSGSRGASEPAP